MSWAKLPTAWLRPVDIPNPSDVTLDDDDVLLDLDSKPEQHYPLTQLAWRKDGSSSMAALMILITLAIRLNESLRGVELDLAKPRPTTVAVTYDELQRATGFARGPVSTGVELLESLGAINRVKVGRANHYELVGLNTNGAWCQIPQSSLLRRDGTLTLKLLERKRITLHALKVYMVLLALRRRDTNTAAISWNGLMRWTGLHRPDVGPAIQLLIAWELVLPSDVLDDRHLEGDDRSKRYRIIGLGRVLHESAMA